MLSTAHAILRKIDCISSIDDSTEEIYEKKDTDKENNNNNNNKQNMYEFNLKNTTDNKSEKSDDLESQLKNSPLIPKNTPLTPTAVSSPVPLEDSNNCVNRYIYIYIYI